MFLKNKSVHPNHGHFPLQVWHDKPTYSYNFKYKAYSYNQICTVLAACLQKPCTGRLELFHNKDLAHQFFFQASFGWTKNWYYTSWIHVTVCHCLHYNLSCIKVIVHLAVSEAEKWQSEVGMNNTEQTFHKIAINLHTY